MLATTRGDLYRDADGEPNLDEYGDETDDNAEAARVAADFPVSIIEARKNVFDEASNAWRQVTYYRIRVNGNLDPRAGDRIKDLRTGDLYVVADVRATPRGLSGRSSVTMNARRAAP